jgi:hypothetical protein
MKKLLLQAGTIKKYQDTLKIKITGSSHSCINLRNQIEYLFFELHKEKQLYAQKYGYDATLKYMLLIEIVKKTIIQINKSIVRQKNYECVVVLEETEIMFLKDHIKTQTGVTSNAEDILSYYE